MSAISSVKTDVFSLQPLTSVIRNIDGQGNEVVELGTHDFWRLDGDNRWRMVVCISGEIWVTQERDVQDYVLTAGDMFIVNQRGSVVIEALCNASVEITPSLNGAPYRGDFPVFQ